MDIPTIALAAVAVLGLIFGALAWLYKRGAEERELTVAVRDNSAATRDLAKTFTAYVEKSDSRYHDHETRLTLAEHDIQDLKTK